MFEATFKSITLKRFQSTVNLESELRKIAKARYLKETKSSEIFPATTRPASHIFPKLEAIDLSKDLQTKEFSASRLGQYHISKTTTGRVPVYTNVRRGQVRETLIRRVEGDVVQLKKDLQAALPDINPKDFKVYQESKKIVIVGDHAAQIRSLLDEVLKK